MFDIKISHYYSSEFEPFHNFLEGKPQISDSLLDQLSSNPNKAFNRYRNFEWYIEQRNRTETWLYNHFITLGGKPKKKHPVYFVLGESNYLLSCFGENGRVKSMFLHHINLDEISFTMEDSMSLFVTDESTIKLFTYNDLLDELNIDNDNIGSVISHLDKQHKYIEAQVWNTITWM